MAGSVLVLQVVGTCSKQSHLVGIEDAALHRRSGRYTAPCGAEVCSSSLATEPTKHCRVCPERAERALGGAAQRN